jgi:LPS export ABC transporter protein LptC
MKDWQWRALKWGSLAISIGSVVVAGIFMWTADDKSLPQAKADTQPEKTSTQVEKPLMVERKGERLIWRLKADVAKQQEGMMLLTQPALELFTENDEIIKVRGNTAKFEPLKRNIHFEGDVTVDYRDWHLVSDDLRFDSTRDEVIVPHHFIATGKDTVIKGRDLNVNRKTQLVHIKHDVWVKDSKPDRLGGLP